MTITTVAINCDIGLANGTEFTAAQIEFTLSEADYDTVSNDSIPAATTVVDLDGSGVGTANLWPVTRGTRNTQYSVVLIGSRTINGRMTSERFTLGAIQPPATGAPFALADLLAQSSGGIVVGSTIYATLADAVAAAVAVESNAELAQAAAEAAALAAETARDEAVAAADGLGGLSTIGAEGPLVSAGDGDRAVWAVMPDGTIRTDWMDRVAVQAKAAAPRPRLYIAGDSRGDQCSDVGRTGARGWLPWLQTLTGGRFDFDPADNIAVAGSTPAEMLAAVGPLLTAPPGIVVAITSTNDRTASLTAAKSIESMALWQALVLDRGHQVVWIAEMPRGQSDNTTYALSGSNLLAHMRVRQWILDQASVPGVFVADPWPVLCDPASASGYVKTGLMYDGLHPGLPGARLIADTMAPIFTTLLPPRPRICSSAADVFSTSNPSGSLTANPMMGGTGGTLGTGASGVIADNWTATAGAGLAVVGSKVTLDGLPAQRLVVSGAPTAPSAGATPVEPSPHSVVLSIPITTSNIAVGDVLELTGLISVAAGSAGCRSVSLYLTLTTASGTTTFCGYEPQLSRSATALEMPATALSGPQIVPRATITEAVTSASVSLMIVGAPQSGVLPNVTLSATVDVTAIALKKVVA